jgi:hypothetical protein
MKDYNMRFGALAWRKRLRKVADPHINIFSGDDRVLGRPIDDRICHKELR